MAVHIQIAEQVRKHREAQKQFLALDSQRERAIDVAIELAKSKKVVQTTDINRITEEMNQIAMQFQFPPRKHVTPEMIMNYINNK
jgi:low affinity Fe/Cu permease